MRNKIFKSIFATIIVVMLATFTVLFAWFCSVMKRTAGEDYNVWLAAAELLAPGIILFTAMTAIAFAVASVISKSVIKPINEIDPEHPEDAKIYEELRPIVEKLSSQNYKISKQMTLLRKRENEFNSITLNMNEGLIVINSRAAILSCNRSAKEIFGDRYEEFVSVNSDDEGRNSARKDALSFGLTSSRLRSVLSRRMILSVILPISSI